MACVVSRSSRRLWLWFPVCVCSQHHHLHGHATLLHLHPPPLCFIQVKEFREDGTSCGSGGRRKWNTVIVASYHGSLRGLYSPLQFTEQCSMQFLIQLPMTGPWISQAFYQGSNWDLETGQVHTVKWWTPRLLSPSLWSPHCLTAPLHLRWPWDSGEWAAEAKY